MKQTAVEWLIDIIDQRDWINYTTEERLKVFEQAKEMEMTQITEAFNDGAENHYDADLYFNKKFKPGYKNEH